MGKKGGRVKMRILPAGIRKRDNPYGFTLLELMLVLLIIGFFSALFSIRIENTFSGGDLRLASRMMIGEISKLRGVAAYTHTDQRMTFHIDGNRFSGGPESEAASPRGEEGLQWPSDKGTRLPRGVRIEDVVIPSKGKIQEGEAHMVFFKNGTVDGVLIHLRNDKDEVYTLEVNPLTGRVTIHDRYIDRQSEA
jgi:prepilin-type N-terminal cleavage/methylation domain-containing protein